MSELEKRAIEISPLFRADIFSLPWVENALVRANGIERIVEAAIYSAFKAGAAWVVKEAAPMARQYECHDPSVDLGDLRNLIGAEDTSKEKT